MTRFGFLSTFPPTRCGLATFTHSLATAMALAPGAAVRIVRVLDAEEAREPAPTPLRADQTVALVPGDRGSLLRAAAALSAGDVAIVQHEYGIYGGSDGDEVLQLMREVRVPVIAVLHTVLAHPTAGQRSVLERVGALAASLVVMTETARTLLLQHYAVPSSKVVLIPHGVHGPRVALPTHERGRNVLTWGLIGPGKGIEWGIRAMGHLADPGAHYTVLGQSHPKVLAFEGERYRDHLGAVIGELGLDDTVTLDDRYLDADSLALAVAAADVVLLPYDSREQVTSGVLVEALAAGLPVVATAFPHAVELLDRGSGIVVPHEDPAAIAEALRSVFSGEAPERPAGALPPAADATWAEVAGRYDALAGGLLAELAA
ncbi:MAG: glycosyltransferase [Acidobacteria bacterium]|nr:glycosyltransferase [Acidobacteriota bacterium]